MKKIAKYALLTLTIISLLCGLACVVFIGYCEFFGYDKGTLFLENIHFPLNDNGIIVACFVCAAILWSSIFLRKKFFR